MKKLLTITALCLVTACSSTAYKYTNKDARKAVSLQSEKIAISKLDLQLIEERITGKSSADNADSGYLNTAGMRKILKDSMVAGLEDKGVYASDAKYDVEVFVDAARSYMAFSKNKYAGLNVKRVDIKVFKDGYLFAEKSLAGKIDCGHNRGFAGNLATIGKTVTGQKGAAEELEDVKACGVAIANTIGKLGS